MPYIGKPPEQGATLSDLVLDVLSHTVPPGLPVDGAAELILTEDIGRVPVLDGEEQLGKDGRASPPSTGSE